MNLNKELGKNHLEDRRRVKISSGTNGMKRLKDISEVEIHKAIAYIENTQNSMEYLPVLLKEIEHRKVINISPLGKALA